MDLKNPKLIYLKGLLFAAILVLSASLIVLWTRDWRIATLLALVVWSSARLYYFAFYVIGKYVDPSFTFSGLIDFARYLLRRRSDD